jgi:hypothetical protein
MKRDEYIDVRWFVGCVTAFAGALLGWGFAELCWRAAHPGLHRWPPARSDAYWLMAIFCSVALAFVGLALVRWRDLPADDESRLSE